MDGHAFASSWLIWILRVGEWFEQCLPYSFWLSQLHPYECMGVWATALDSCYLWTHWLLLLIHLPSVSCCNCSCGSVKALVLMTWATKEYIFMSVVQVS